MTNILIGAYIGITTLLLVNIFIAMLTSTFSRVHDSSKAFFVLQRAIEIVRLENRLSSSKRFKHLSELREDFVDDKYSVVKDYESGLSDKLDPVKDSVKDIQEEIADLQKKLENFETHIVIVVVRIDFLPLKIVFL
jgi:peptidoglycan hydrolase CwlO-like protein